MTNKPSVATPASDQEETYDEWFVRQVDQAIAAADKPDAVWYTHEEVRARGEARRAAIKARMQKETGS